MHSLPPFLSMGYTRKTPNRGGLDMYTFLKKPQEFFRFVNLLLADKLLRLRILQNCVTPPQGFYPIIFAKLPDSLWLLGSQVP